MQKSKSQIIRFSKAIVRKPSKSMVNGITTADLGLPDYDLAMSQHKDYVKCLQECGVKVTILEALEECPDSVFIEDTAVVFNKLAVISRPAPESRQGEVETVAEVLRTIFPKTVAINSPGTFEGGDVMQIGRTFYIGLTDRTNEQGANQFIRALADVDCEGIKVPMRNLLHLKTGISFLGDDTILVGQELMEENCFESYNKLKVFEEEAYAANCIRVNDYVIIPECFPKTKNMLNEAGFKIKTVQMSEFQKLDGGLSCLSLRF